MDCESTENGYRALKAQGWIRGESMSTYDSGVIGQSRMAMCTVGHHKGAQPVREDRRRFGRNIH